MMGPHSQQNSLSVDLILFIFLADSTIVRIRSCDSATVHSSSSRYSARPSLLVSATPSEPFLCESDQTTRGTYSSGHGNRSSYRVIPTLPRCSPHYSTVRFMYDVPGTAAQRGGKSRPCGGPRSRCVVSLFSSTYRSEALFRVMSHMRLCAWPNSRAGANATRAHTCHEGQ
ncbi:hypothetical protein BV20DRAFT_690935 [Pilatotrama ljubarskyi]|nr:hypothetical protein BV20DRAFT_690935 [Pilatotrama ljubarskyi]